MRLALLAPDCRGGEDESGAHAEKLERSLPASWEEQRATIESTTEPQAATSGRPSIALHLAPARSTPRQKRLLIAPDLVEAILAGSTEQVMMLEKIERPLPASWEEQRAMIESTTER